jgi:hypothetical protein
MGPNERLHFFENFLFRKFYGLDSTGLQSTAVINLAGESPLDSRSGLDSTGLHWTPVHSSSSFGQIWLRKSTGVHMESSGVYMDYGGDRQDLRSNLN